MSAISSRAGRNTCGYRQWKPSIAPSDAIGNLYETQSRTDRKYDADGRLKEDPNYNYYYDCEGNLIFKEFRKPQGYKAWGKEAIEKKFGIKMKATGTGWYYKWAANGMLMRVVNPEKGIINFGYDPFGTAHLQGSEAKTHLLALGRQCSASRVD